jgi:DNA-nicking Smr family endonuclease
VNDQEDGDDLWGLYTRDIKPLPGKKVVKKQTVKKQSAEKVKKKPEPEPAIRKAKPTNQALPETDRRTVQKLRRGQMNIEACLDLHGLSRREARDALESFIIKSQNRGLRCVLVITGKGGLGENAGVLRQNVPLWLEEAPLSSLVLSYAGARPKDGGAGALYILIRRKR